ncbi:hypothetical protein BX600DRAFT_436155 [Xylariales sp. PMI_506]|nr:hypothetical protein BX600DRAFT_436155 [Xylariales sp. PMI_506]
MPKLKTLEIWNGRVGSAALFRYKLEEAVARAHDSKYFVLRELLDETISINSHADAINYLELFKVLRPVSLQQILAAHKMRHEGMPQGLNLARPKPVAIHQKPSFSAKYWSKALRYYCKFTERYDFVPMRIQHVEEREEDHIALLRERGIDVDSGLELLRQGGASWLI